jgi:uncharacterized membrane protein YhdT
VEGVSSDSRPHHTPLCEEVGHPPLMSLLCLVLSVGFLLPMEAVEGSLGASSRFAWCALLWTATLSLPQAACGTARWTVGLGLGLCVLGLAAQLDLSSGCSASDVWALAWPTLLFLFLLPAAAARAKGSKRAVHYALLWFLFIVGTPLFAHALEIWGGMMLPRWFEFICSASPLDWIASQLNGGGEEPWLPLGVAVLLFAVTAVAGLEGEAESEA